jgi:hypothetical protein
VTDIVGVGWAGDCLTEVLEAGGGADAGSADPEQATTENSAAVTAVTASSRRRTVMDKLMGDSWIAVVCEFLVAPSSPPTADASVT